MNFKYAFNIILSIYKSCDWIYFSHGMVIEIILNNKIQFFFRSISNFKSKNICLCTLLEKL
jgi:hypothetical protein